MRIEESLFQKVNIGSTHPHDFIVTIMGTHFKLGEISLRLFGKMEEGYTPKITLPLANIYKTQELDTQRICLPFSYQSNRKDYNK